MRISSATFIICAGLMYVAIAWAPTRAEAVEQTRSWDPVVTARLGLSNLVQEDHAPPLCCAQRDSWNARGPALALRVGHLLGSRILLSAEASYAYHESHDGKGLRIHAGGMALDLGVVAFTGTPRVTLGVGAGIVRFSGSALSYPPWRPEVKPVPGGPREEAPPRPPAEGRRVPLEEMPYSGGGSTPELHVRLGLDVPIGGRLSAGVELLATKTFAEHLFAATATVSYWLGKANRS